MSKLIYSRNQRAIFLTLCANFHPSISRCRTVNSEQTNQLKIHAKLKCKSLDELLINTPRRYGMKSFQFFNIEFLLYAQETIHCHHQNSVFKNIFHPSQLNKGIDLMSVRNHQPKQHHLHIFCVRIGAN